MTVYECAKKRRTIRAFKQDEVERGIINEIIDCARLAPCAANLQPLRFAIIKDKSAREQLFPYIKYAGYLPNWNPKFTQTPPVFIAVLNDTEIKPSEHSESDCGAAIASMCLAAEEKGLATCWLGAVDRKRIKKILALDSEFDILYLLGLGYPDQSAKSVPYTDNPKYYFDENKTLCVPKRSLEDVIITEV